jgi:hypothetical protein
MYSWFAIQKYLGEALQMLITRQRQEDKSMPKFLIEVPHEEEAMACTRAVRILLESGSHFLTHAEWGCKDGVHKAWLFADVDNKDQALAIVPPAYRSQTRIVQLNHFSIQEVDELVRYHGGLVR